MKRPRRRRGKGGKRKKRRGERRKTAREARQRVYIVWGREKEGGVAKRAWGPPRRVKDLEIYLQ